MHEDADMTPVTSDEPEEVTAPRSEDAEAEGSFESDTGAVLASSEASEPAAAEVQEGADGAPADDDGAPDPSAGAPNAGDEGMSDLAARAEAEGTSMMALLLAEGDFLPGQYQRGDIVEGTVASKGRDQLTVNLGAKQEAVVPSSDIARVPKAVWDGIHVGDTLQLVVMRPDGRDGEIVLSLSQALSAEDWIRAEQMLESGEVVELEIVGFNRGGLLAGFGGLQGFIPRSQMARPMPEGGPERMVEFVGQRVVVKVVEVSRAKRRLIMSERQAAREWRSERKRALLGDLKEGDTRRGRVTSIADFGVFVDLGGADGLVHVSEMGFDRNRKPADIVKIGDEVDVLVLSIDRERKRIGLSMKRLQKDPWVKAADEHYIGELVDGVVVNLADFGAFVRLPDHLEGLIHISEISDAAVRHPSDVLRAGQTVTVEIIALDPERQRLGLSLRRVPEHLRAPEPTDAADAVAPAAAPEPTRTAAPEAEAMSGDEAAGSDIVGTAEEDGAPYDAGAGDSAAEDATGEGRLE
ncbi:MAG: S1 RNA-binding domain-containing protein [Anaerolineae bacterium]